MSDTLGVTNQETCDGDRMQLPEGMHRNQDLIASVMEISPIGITVVDREGQITFANARAEEVLGLARDRITRRTYNAPEWNITDLQGDPFPDDQLPFSLIMSTAKAVFDIRHAIQWPDGRRVLLSVNAVPILNREGEADGMVATVEDITDRIEAEEALRVKESAIASSLNAIAMADLDGNLLYVNDSFINLWGYQDKNEVEGRSVIGFWHEEERAAQVVKALQTEGRFMGELVAIKKDNTPFSVQLSASMATDDDGKPICMMSSFVDITERKRSEQALRESEQKFRSIIERSPDGVALTDENGVIIEWNPGAERITGLLRKDVIGKFLWDIQVAMAVEERRTIAVRERNRDMLLGLLKTGRADWLARLQDMAIERADGTQRVLQSLIFVIKTAQGHRVGSILRDVTESNRAEEEIRKLSRAIEQSPSTVVITDTEGRVEYANPKFSELTGYSNEEILGDTPSVLKSGEHDPGFYEGLWKTISAGKDWRDEFANRKKNGEIYWELASISPVRNADGVVTHYVKVAEDITKRKEAEEALRQRTDELEARNKELDAFAHTVAHDLQSPLSVIIGFAETLEQESSQVPGKDLRRYLRVIAQHGRKMSNIVEELLLLAGLREMEVESVPLDMAGIVREATLRMADLIERQEAEIVLPASWPSAVGYGPWVEEVWVNYISNAIRYGGRPPRVELGAELVTIPSISDGEQTLPVDAPIAQVRFWVWDNGEGLSPEEQARLFVPFTQLAQAHVEGHGLGLSIVRRIIDKLGGQVGVESEGKPGKGCKFYFTLQSATKWSNK